VPAAELTATQPNAHPGAGARASWRAWLTGGRSLITLSALSLAIAAASLALPSTPSYDPWAWLVWGREIIHLNLHTQGGPSWKPLPMIFTVTFALFGSAQPNLWLVVARAGALMCLVMAFRLAWRLTIAVAPAWARDHGGAARALLAAAAAIAALLAAGSLVNSPGFISDNALGYSEGFATALMLAAVERFLDGHRRQAFALGFLTALDRPEIWFFWVPYGIYLAWRDRRARGLVASLFVLVPVLWFGPPLWSSGHAFEAVTRALHPRSNSAAFSACPICTVFRQEAWPTLLNRIKIPAILAIVAAAAQLWRTRTELRTPGSGARERAQGFVLVALLGAFGLVWWFGIAVETDLGFSGNGRYLVLGTAPLAIAGGVAWGWLALGIGQLWRAVVAHAREPLRRARRAIVALPVGCLATVGLFFAVPPWVGRYVISLPLTHRALVYQADLRQDLAEIVHRYGAHRLLTCGDGQVMVEGFQVPMVAWYLHVRTLRIEEQPPVVEAPAPWPSVILQDRDTGSAALLPLWQTINHWRALGARYRIVDYPVFRLFMDCRK
jgi:hypothetical protein